MDYSLATMPFLNYHTCQKHFITFIPHVLPFSSYASYMVAIMIVDHFTLLYCLLVSLCVVEFLVCKHSIVFL